MSALVALTSIAVGAEEWRQKADLAADEPEEGNREERRLRDDVERRATRLEENGCTGASQHGRTRKGRKRKADAPKGRRPKKERVMSAMWAYSTAGRPSSL